MNYVDFLRSMNNATEIWKKEAEKWLRQKAIEIMEKEYNRFDTLTLIHDYMIEKEKQDERWQALTEDGRQARIASYQELLKLQREEADSYLITIEDLEKLYGKHNLRLPIKKEGWVNVYDCGKGDRLCKLILPTEEEAKENISDEYHYIATVKIEWEE